MRKTEKSKSKEERLTDMMNYHIAKGNIREDDVKPSWKDKIKKVRKL